MPGIDETTNQFRFRARDPALFIDGSFRTKRLGDGVSIIVGRLKNPPKGHSGSAVTQSYHFDKKSFQNKEEVRAWLKKNRLSTAYHNFSSQSFMIIAQDETMNSFNEPQKPTDGDNKKCPKGRYKDPKTGKCIKISAGLQKILDEAIKLHQTHINNPKTATLGSQERLMKLIINARSIL